MALYVIDIGHKADIVKLYNNTDSTIMCLSKAQLKEYYTHGTETIYGVKKDTLGRLRITPVGITSVGSGNYDCDYLENELMNAMPRNARQVGEIRSCVKKIAQLAVELGARRENFSTFNKNGVYGLKWVSTRSVLDSQIDLTHFVVMNTGILTVPASTMTMSTQNNQNNNINRLKGIKLTQYIPEKLRLPNNRIWIRYSVYDSSDAKLVYSAPLSQVSNKQGTQRDALINGIKANFVESLHKHVNSIHTCRKLNTNVSLNLHERDFVQPAADIYKTPKKCMISSPLVTKFIGAASELGCGGNMLTNSNDRQFIELGQHVKYALWYLVSLVYLGEGAVLDIDSIRLIRKPAELSIEFKLAHGVNSIDCSITFVDGEDSCAVYYRLKNKIVSSTLSIGYIDINKNKQLDTTDLYREYGDLHHVLILNLLNNNLPEKYRLNTLDELSLYRSLVGNSVKLSGVNTADVWMVEIYNALRIHPTGIHMTRGHRPTLSWCDIHESRNVRLTISLTEVRFINMSTMANYHVAAEIDDVSIGGTDIEIDTCDTNQYSLNGLLNARAKAQIREIVISDIAENKDRIVSTHMFKFPIDDSKNSFTHIEFEKFVEKIGVPKPEIWSAVVLAQLGDIMHLVELPMTVYTNSRYCGVKLNISSMDGTPLPIEIHVSNRDPFDFEIQAPWCKKPARQSISLLHSYENSDTKIKLADKPVWKHGDTYLGEEFTEVTNNIANALVAVRPMNIKERGKPTVHGCAINTTLTVEYLNKVIVKLADSLKCTKYLPKTRTPYGGFIAETESGARMFIYVDACSHAIIATPAYEYLPNTHQTISIVDKYEWFRWFSDVEGEPRVSDYTYAVMEKLRECLSKANKARRLNTVPEAKYIIGPKGSKWNKESLDLASRAGTSLGFLHTWISGEKTYRGMDKAMIDFITPFLEYRDCKLKFIPDAMFKGVAWEMTCMRKGQQTKLHFRYYMAPCLNDSFKSSNSDKVGGLLLIKTDDDKTLCIWGNYTGFWTNSDTAHSQSAFELLQLLAKNNIKLTGRSY